ncbi:2-dehydropantoate 2-reductase [Paenibacillus sp. PastF-3]|uniref:ketopantoate reductase family protein n=1 Tax=Paenibacillus sp. PastF-3 TaxID=2940626 RepID=UPI002473E62E|nr:ketopantoate reductase family protein [Paenibacillus sp. PastF-3]MDH6371628.1 2-dehydropantoate 2-reductase [Paenibacillus sp. PastF-3]
MRFLIVGAGAIGGYFGGRLVQKGEDVTFLVRNAKQIQLEADGLIVKSVHGDFQTSVRTISNREEAELFDCIIIAVKAYHLPQVMNDIEPYVGEHTLILPLLNGYDQFSILQKRFGPEHVLGGLCYIETTLDSAGTIVQSSSFHSIVFGEWAGGESERTRLLLSHLDHAGFTVSLSSAIQREVWQKYIFVASLSGITTLMDSSVGPIFASPKARAIYEQLLQEIVSLAQNAGMPVGPENIASTMGKMRSVLPEFTSSMHRDMHKLLPVEADHLHGALLAMAVPGQGAYPVLETVYARLKVYESVNDMN